MNDESGFCQYLLSPVILRRRVGGRPRAGGAAATGIWSHRATPDALSFIQLVLSALLKVFPHLFKGKHASDGNNSEASWRHTEDGTHVEWRRISVWLWSFTGGRRLDCCMEVNCKSMSLLQRSLNAFMLEVNTSIMSNSSDTYWYQHAAFY